MKDETKTKAVETLNKILEMELAGTIHYTHYSFMVFGYNRIPIVSWMEQQATESMAHARAAGELVTQLGAHPSLAIGPLLETHKHDIGDILRESLAHEQKTLVEYEKLLTLVQGEDVMLEEFAREHIYLERLHIGEVDKMLRKPGDIESIEKAAKK
ncbi:MAG TPA: ferritin-like domain-containing protein [Terriglobia bacterium]|jgi:bacterioferritin